jgi:hypothetical protein
MTARHFFVLTLSLCFFACSDGDEGPGSTTDTVSAQDWAGGDNASSSICPPPLEGVSCEEKNFWAKSPDTGECCKYLKPCTPPTGWEKFMSEATCEKLTPPQEACPPAKGDLPEEIQCEEKQVWTYLEEQDVCCVYDGFCMVPFGFEYHENQESCEALVTTSSKCFESGTIKDVPVGCPPGKEGECEEKTLWAKNSSTGVCCQYSGFCKVPQGWETYKDSDTCENDAQ